MRATETPATREPCSPRFSIWLPDSGETDESARKLVSRVFSTCETESCTAPIGRLKTKHARPSTAALDSPNGCASQFSAGSTATPSPLR